MNTSDIGSSGRLVIRCVNPIQDPTEARPCAVPLAHRLGLGLGVQLPGFSTEKTSTSC